MSAVNLTPVNLLRAEFGVNRLVRAEDKRLVTPGLKDDAQPACGFFTRFKLFDEQPVLLPAAVRPPVGSGLAEDAAKPLRPVEASIKRREAAKALARDHGTVGAVAEGRELFYMREKFFLHRQPEIAVTGQFAAAMFHVDRIN